MADSLSPHSTKQLAEDLGIEHDTPEHVELERGQFCGASKRRRVLLLYVKGKKSEECTMALRL